MKAIEIDEEIYAYLQSKAIPYEDKTPNDTIRRLFGFDKKATPPRPISSPQERSRMIQGRKKQPKASLIDLVNAGLLEEGQILHLTDYQKRDIPDSEAAVHQGGLLRDGKKYSMSNLAEKLLKAQGYTSNSVQGPARWFTSDNISIKTLWENYPKNKNGA
ncbi:MAG: hypothetical protein WCD80_12995 [Desulfobaccales bacterium]